MQSLKELEWEIFAATGDIEDYLKYKEYDRQEARLDEVLSVG